MDARAKFAPCRGKLGHSCAHEPVRICRCSMRLFKCIYVWACSMTYGTANGRPTDKQVFGNFQGRLTYAGLSTYGNVAFAMNEFAHVYISSCMRTNLCACYVLALYSALGCRSSCTTVDLVDTGGPGGRANACGCGNPAMRNQRVTARALCNQVFLVVPCMRVRHVQAGLHVSVRTFQFHTTRTLQ